MPDVFLSYKREERDVAQELAKALSAQGCSVWWDVDLLPGDRFAQEIEAVIQQAKAAIVIWSRQSIESDWVIEEATEAKRRDILIPVRIDSVEPPFGFRGLHTLDLSAWDRRHDSDCLDDLIGLVRRQIDGSPASNEHQIEAKSLDAFNLEAEFWRTIASASQQSAAEYQTYIDRFGEHAQFADLARARIEALKAARPTQFFDSWIARVGSVIAVLGALVAIVVSLPDDDSINTGDQTQSSSSGDQLGQGEQDLATNEPSFEVVSATLSFSGDNNDYVTAGQNYNFIHGGNAFFTVSELSTSQISFGIETPDSWSFDLSVPVSDDFSVGLAYKASRDGFSGDHFAGLDVSGDGRGCNKIDGTFEIESLQLDRGIPVAARINFTQFCDSQTAKAQGFLVYKVSGGSE